MGIKRRWDAACAETIGEDIFWRIAVDHISIARQLVPLIERHARGVVLDAGAGRLAWRSLLEPKAVTYLATDFSPTHLGLAFRADLQGKLPLGDRSVDTIFCCSVLEHVPEPWLVLPEFSRVLRDDGRIILSVPFLYYLHGAPADYFRFTRYGIERLAHAAGLEVIETTTGGGLAHTISQAFSMVFTALLWTRRAPWLATSTAWTLFQVAQLADRLDRSGVFAQSVNVVLKKATSS